MALSINRNVTRNPLLSLLVEALRERKPICASTLLHPFFFEIKAIASSVTTEMYLTEKAGKIW